MTLALLALALAQTDAGLPDAVYAERAQVLLFGGNWVEGECFATDDGGTACSGAWVPEPRLIAVGRELASLRVENEALRASPPVLSWFSLLALGLGFLGGVATVGYLWWSFGR